MKPITITELENELQLLTKWFEEHLILSGYIKDNIDSFLIFQQKKIDQSNLYYELATEYEKQGYYSEAITAYLEAAKLTSATNANVRLGFRYQNVTQSTVQLDEYKKLISETEFTHLTPHEMSLLAYQYLSGMGKPRSPQKAIVIFHQAAELDCCVAMNALACLYNMENIFRENEELSLKYLLKASELNDYQAQINLCHLIKNAMEFQLYEKKLSPYLLQALVFFKKQIVAWQPQAIRFLQKYNEFLVEQDAEFLKYTILINHLNEIDKKENVNQEQDDFIVSDSELELKIITQLNCMNEARDNQKMFDFLYNDVILRWRDFLFSGVSGGGYINLYFFLFYECLCPDTGRFNRFINNRRQQIEDTVVTDLQTYMSFSDTIRYLSLGAGGLLQDLFILIKLINAGYTSFEIFLVEPELDEQVKNVFIHVLTFVTQEKNLTIAIGDYASMEAFKQVHPNQEIDLLLGIDCGDFMSSLDAIVEAHQSLSEKGRFYLSFGETNYIFNQQGCYDIKKYDEASGQYQQCIDHMNEEIRINFSPHTVREKVLRYLSLSTSFHGTEWVENIPKLINNGFEEAYIGLLKPNDIFSKEKVKEQYNQPKNIVYIISLFLKKSVKVHVKIYDDIAAIIADKQHENYQLITLYNFSRLFDIGMPILKAIHDTFPEAIKLYAVHLSAAVATKTLEGKRNIEQQEVVTAIWQYHPINQNLIHCFHVEPNIKDQFIGEMGLENNAIIVNKNKVYEDKAILANTNIINTNVVNPNTKRNSWCSYFQYSTPPQPSGTQGITVRLNRSMSFP